MRPYRAEILINNSNKTSILYWSNYRSTDKKNWIDAGKQWIKNNGNPEELQVLKVSRLTYSEYMEARYNVCNNN